MNLIEEIRWGAAFAIAALAWLSVAEHPTARNFRRAVIDTLSL
jgi:hypothetical protein